MTKFATTMLRKLYLWPDLLELVDGQFTRDQDGQIVEYLEAGDNRLLFTKVIDKRPDGDGVDYLRR